LYFTPIRKHDTAINVWGGFSYNGVSQLALVQGNMDAHQYTRILDGYMIPAVTQLFGGFEYLFVHDNDPKHKSKAACEFLKNRAVNVLPFPPYSPDLNPIENLWSILNQRASGRRSTTARELFRVISNTWNAIPVDI
jgi:hypothetical protein